MYGILFFGGLHGRTNQNLQTLGGPGHHRRLHLHQSHAEQEVVPNPAGDDSEGESRQNQVPHQPPRHPD